MSTGRHVQFVVEGEHGCAFLDMQSDSWGRGGSFYLCSLFLLFFQSQPTHKNVFPGQTTLLNSEFLSSVELRAGDREPEDPLSQAQCLRQEPAELHRR